MKICFVEHAHKPLKKKFYNSSLRDDIFLVTDLWKKETGIIEKLDYSSLQWCAICRDYVIMECAVLLNIGQSQKWNVAKCIVFNTEVSISFEDAMCFE